MKYLRFIPNPPYNIDSRELRVFRRQANPDRKAYGAAVLKAVRAQQQKEFREACRRDRREGSPGC